MRSARVPALTGVTVTGPVFWCVYFVFLRLCTRSNHIQEREEMEQKPVFTVEGVTYVYVQYNNLILMSVTKRNSNVALMLVYLYKLVRK